MSCGIIYVVSGGRSYIGELLASLKSLRQHEPELPVTVFSQFALPRPLPRFCEEARLSPDAHPLKLKVMMLRKSPYDSTLFLDTDISILGPLRPVFAELETADFAAANAHVADWTVKPPRFVAMVKPNEYNTGVLLFKKSDPTLRLLDRWEAAVRDQDERDMWPGHHCDQYYFNELILQGLREETGVSFRELDNVVYNARGSMRPEIRRLGRESEIRIFHHRTTAMKLRKALFSLTDGPSLRELALKIVNHARGKGGT